MASGVASRLADIAEQIEVLQAKAREVVENALTAAELHKAKCGIEKRVGQIYHLYRRSGGGVCRVAVAVVVSDSWLSPP